MEKGLKICKKKKNIKLLKNYDFALTIYCLWFKEQKMRRIFGAQILIFVTTSVAWKPPIRFSN